MNDRKIADDGFADLSACTDDDSVGSPWFLRPNSAIVLVTILAGGLRFFNLGDIAFFGDEYSNVESVVGSGITETAWPFLFSLQRWFCGQVGLTELTLRLFPATFGVVSIPLFYLAGRESFGRWTMVFAGLFISLNHWHLFHSQSGRFYTAVFLCSGLAFLWLVASLRTSRPAPAVWSAVATAIGVGFHPTAAWLAIVFGGYCGLSLFVRELRRPLTVRIVAGFFLPLVIAGGIALVSLLSTLEFVGGGLAHAGFGGGPKYLFLSWVRGLELPLVTVAGIWLLGFVGKNRAFGVFAFLTALAPIMGLMILGEYTSVRRDYVFWIAPIWFILGGSASSTVFCSKSIPFAARISVCAALSASFLPSMISHHSANLTCDRRLAFSFLKEHAKPDAIVYHGFVTMVPYYTGLESEYLQTGDVKFSEQIESIEAKNEECWFLLQRQRSGLVGNAGLETWLEQHAKRMARFDAKRFDYEAMSLLIFKYEPQVSHSNASAQ